MITFHLLLHTRLQNSSSLISNKNFQNEAKKYDIINDKVDEFYERFLDSPTYVDLKYIVYLVTILSHGNAARVESGFSINADILQVNMLEENVVSQRLV